MKEMVSLYSAEAVGMVLAVFVISPACFLSKPFPGQPFATRALKSPGVR
jgi:hypothetical protein